MHALWDCESLHQIWSVDFHWIDRHRASAGSVKNLVELIIAKPNKLELFATTAWFLWSRRNKLRLNNEVLPLNRVVTEAKRFLSLYKLAPQTRMKQNRAVRNKWVAPVRNEYKTNLDGAMIHDTGEVGLGVVIWNHEGEVMAALSEKIPQPPSVTQLELLAARRAALFVQEVGLHNSILEGDSEIVINSLKRCDMFQSAFGHLIQDTLVYVNAL